MQPLAYSPVSVETFVGNNLKINTDSQTVNISKSAEHLGIRFDGYVALLVKKACF